MGTRHIGMQNKSFRISGDQFCCNLEEKEPMFWSVDVVWGQFLWGKAVIMGS